MSETQEKIIKKRASRIEDVLDSDITIDEMHAYFEEKENIIESALAKYSLK